MIVGRLNVLKIEEKNKIQDPHFFLLSYCDRFVINMCQKSDADEIVEGFEVILLLWYNNIFSKWSHIEQVVSLVVVCKGCSKHFRPGKKTWYVAGDDRGGEGESFVFRAVQLGRIITLQMNILKCNSNHGT